MKNIYVSLLILSLSFLLMPCSLDQYNHQPGLTIKTKFPETSQDIATNTSQKLLNTNSNDHIPVFVDQIFVDIDELNIHLRSDKTEEGSLTKDFSLPDIQLGDNFTIKISAATCTYTDLLPDNEGKCTVTHEKTVSSDNIPFGFENVEFKVTLETKSGVELYSDENSYIPIVNPITPADHYPYCLAMDSNDNFYIALLGENVPSDGNAKLYLFHFDYNNPIGEIPTYTTPNNITLANHWRLSCTIDNQGNLLIPYIEDETNLHLYRFKGASGESEDTLLKTKSNTDGPLISGPGPSTEPVFNPSIDAYSNRVVLAWEEEPDVMEDTEGNYLYYNIYLSGDYDNPSIETKTISSDNGFKPLVHIQDSLTYSLISFNPLSPENIAYINVRDYDLQLGERIGIAKEQILESDTQDTPFSVDTIELLTSFMASIKDENINGVFFNSFVQLDLGEMLNGSYLNPLKNDNSTQKHVNLAKAPGLKFALVFADDRNDPGNNSGIFYNVISIEDNDDYVNARALEFGSGTAIEDNVNDLNTPLIAINPDGLAVVSWIDGTNSRIYFKRLIF